MNPRETAQQIIDAYSKYEFPINIHKIIIENIGIRIFEANSFFDMIIHISEYDPCFIVSNKKSKEEIKYTLAHLLGHFLFKQEHNEYFRKYFKESFLLNEKDATNEEEQFATEFAYELLMPKNKFGFLSNLFKIYNKQKLIDKFNVNERMIEERIQQIKYNKKYNYNTIKIEQKDDKDIIRTINLIYYPNSIKVEKEKEVDLGKLKRKIKL